MWTPIREELRGASRLEVFPRDPNLSVATCMGALIVKNSQLKGKQEIRVSDRMKDSAEVRAAGELPRKEWKKQTKKERQKHWVESSNEDRKGTTLISSIANNTAAHRLGDVRHMLVSDTRDGWEKHATYRNGVILLGGDGGVALWSVHKLGEIDVPGTKSKARRDDLHDVTAVCKIQRGELCHWLVGRDRGALLLLEAKTLASLRAFTLELPSPLLSAAAAVVSALAVPTGGPISEDDFHGAEEQLSPQLLCAGFGDGRIDCYDADHIKVPES